MQSRQHSEADGSRRSTTVFFSTRLLSQAGQGVFLAGLFLAAGQQDAAALGLSSLMAAMMAAAVIFGLPGGALADRMGPGRALVLGATGRAVAIGLALGIALTPGLSGRIELVALAAFLYSGVSQLFSPAELALVAAISPRRPQGTHALLIALQHAGQAAGIVVLAPVAYLLGGAPAMLAVALACYAGVSVLAIVLAARVVAPPAVARGSHTLAFGRTARFFARNEHAAYAGLLLAFAEVASKGIFVAVPAYLAHDLGLDRAQTIALIAPGALGALGGMAWAARSLHAGLAPQVMRYALAGTVAGVVALAVLGDAIAGMASSSEAGPLQYLHDPRNLSVAIAVPVALLLGVCFSIAPIGARTVLTATAPAGQQSRVFAMQSTLTDLLAILPLLLAGLGAEFAGARVTFLFLGALGAVFFAVLETPHVRAMLRIPAAVRGEA